ncbi:MAG: Nif3-like dinuclear metal center hexameric protein [Verrucomicrobia bacterium]|nr:Nif3-like dinuclear metal center hexameric protein [Verrucomicrobiota bacterium]
MKHRARLKTVVNAMQDLYPLSWAEDWDNVGLLIEPTGNPEIRKCLLTIDLTEQVLKEARSVKAQMILAYHPVIFDPLTRITSASAKERIIRESIQRNLAVYSPHTALDAAPGGVNDWLADALGEGDRYCIQPQPGSDSCIGQGRVVHLNDPVTLRTLARRIRNRLRLKHVRIAYAEKHRKRGAKIRTVAVCAGAGASVLQDAEADVYLTGEMRHHDILAATGNGTSVILCEHTNSERGYLKVLKRNLTKAFEGRIRFIVSKEDREPLSVLA